MATLRVPDLGSYLRDQRVQAQLSLRQLAAIAGVSNPYLSQVERGLRRPSADVLQQIARALHISAEALYVRAGIMDDRPESVDVLTALSRDQVLTERQRRVLTELYLTFADAPAGQSHDGPDVAETASPATASPDADRSHQAPPSRVRRARTPRTQHPRKAS